MGLPTDLPWAIGYEGVALHPVQLYSLLGATVAALLVWSLPETLPGGARFALAAVLLGLWRSLTEFFTIQPGTGTLSLTQWSYLGLAAVAFLAYRSWATASLPDETPSVEDQVVEELQQEFATHHPDRPRSSASRWAPRVVVALLTVLIVSNAALAVFREPGQLSSTEERPALTYRAPQFELRTLEGSTVTLGEFRGKVVMINFWATWCPPCKAEMPHIQRVHERFGDRVVILGVDLAEPEHIVRQYVEEHGYTWRFALDTDGTVSDRYLVRYIPTTFFVDPNGIIRRIYTGPMTENEIISYLREAGM